MFIMVIERTNYMKIALVFCRIDHSFDQYPAGVFSIFESNPPLGPAAVGTIAQKKGFDVRVFDQLLDEYDNEQLLQAIELYHPDMVGFGCTSLNIDNSEICARLLHKKGYLTFAGGIHITLCADKVQKQAAFDFLICGEGEEIFSEVLDFWMKNHNLSTFKHKGFRWRDDFEDSGVAVLSEVNQPIINRDIIEIHRYKNKGALLENQPCYSLFSSRGCPFSCRFCSKPEYFKLYRERSLDNVFEEIDLLVEKYDAQAISFREDNFTVHPKRLEDFCHKMIQKFNGKLFWECESRADMPIELLPLMYRSGCRGIWCGIETIVPRWSEWIRKGLTKEQVIKFYDECQRIGIKTGALFMFGFPFQSRDELEEDINFALSLPTVFSAFQCLAIFPGSPLYEYYKIHSELKHQVTDEVALALTEGKTWQEMIQLEYQINKRIQSVRLSYQN